MSVDQQQQQDQICPTCRKAIRKRSKGSFTAWIFQDSICRCGKLGSADALAEEVLAASSDNSANAQAQTPQAVDRGQMRKRSLLGESVPGGVPIKQSQAPMPASAALQANTQTPANTQPPVSSQAAAPAPTMPQALPSHYSQQLFASSDSYTGLAAQSHPTLQSRPTPLPVPIEKPGLITSRDLIVASITSVMLLVVLKLSGNNDQIVMGLVAVIIIAALIVVGLRSMRK